MKTAHDFTLRTIRGEARSLDEYRGKALLIVNVASKCGMTPQYADLQALYDEYEGRGLVVLGIPCNQFADQEPGSEAEIEQFCSLEYGVTFPMFAKVDVNGPDRHPLYAWLTEQDAAPEGAGDVKWNFGKFLVDREGRLVARFKPTKGPRSDDVRKAIEAALGS